MTEDRQKKVRLYALSTCPACKMVKTFLEKYGVPYEMVAVDTLDGGEQWLMTKEVKKYNPLLTYPTLVIEEVILGFDEARMKKALGIP